VAKGDRAPPVNRVEGLAVSCATGYRTGGASAQPQRSARLWPVSKHSIPNDAPDQIGYNAVAAEIIRRKREPVYEKPCLRKGEGKRTVIGSKSADRECNRRKVDCRLYRRLSRYYRLPKGNEWTRPPLLRKGKHGRGITPNITLTQTLSIRRSQGPQGLRVARGPRGS